MTSTERDEIVQLNVRLFGLDGNSGVLGDLTSKVDSIESRLDRWDGAMTLVKAAAGVLGIGGIGLILRVLSGG